MARSWADQSLLERMASAVERVRDRLIRATAALEAAGVPYAVIGGNAVAAWVATIDPGGVRNTKDVDILLRRDDLNHAKAALAKAGFIYYELQGIGMFLDGPTAGPRDAVHVIIANEKVKPHDAMAAPDVLDAARPENFQVVALEALLRMKLTSFRDRDKTHVRDMLDIGLIDASWKNRLPAELAERLQMLIDTPGG